MMDIEGLLDLYGARDQLDRLRTIREAIKHAEDWWSEYVDLLQSPVQAWLGLESVAARLYTFDSHVIPPLLQVGSYLEEVLRAWHGRADDQLRRLVDLDRNRQGIQEARTSPAELVAIIDQQVLHRRVGDADLMKQQLSHLLKASRRPNLTIHILPGNRGLQGCMDASFAIATMPESFGHHPGGAFVPSHRHRGWLQNLSDKDAKALRQGACYRQHQEVQLYRAAWDQLHEQALDPEQSRNVIEQALSEW